MGTNTTTPDVSQFFREVTADTRAPLIDKEALRAGVLVRYDGSRDVATRGPNAKRESNTLHTFTVLDAPEPRTFALWGTGALNNQLGKVAKRALLFLVYGGKATADDGSGVAVHQWRVAVANRALADLPDAMRATFRPNALALVEAIDAAAAEEARKFAERAQRGGNGAPRDDDGYYAALDADGPR